MKNLNSIVTATCTRSNSHKSSLDDSKSSSFNDFEPPIIRLKLDKPLHWDWELTTSSSSSLPIIQLLNKNGKVMVETSENTAQRARGSFLKGLTQYEGFPLENKSRSRSRSRIKTSSSFSYPGDSKFLSRESVSTVENNKTSKASSSFSFSPTFGDSKNEELSNEKSSNGTTSSASTEHFSRNPNDIRSPYRSRLQGNRNVDGFSTKFGTTAFGSCGYKPLKSKSEIIVRETDKGRRKKRIKKRFSGELEDIRKIEDGTSKQASEYTKRNNEQTRHFEDNRNTFNVNRIPNDSKEFNNNNNNLRKSTVKRSNTFRIIDGSENIEELEEDNKNLECNNVLMNKSNEDIAKDYFKRVYELLKKKKEEKILDKEKQREDSSSSFDFDEEMKKRRLRRKKRERGIKVEERSNSPQTQKNEGKSVRKQFSKSKEFQLDSLSFKINEKERKKEEEIKERPQDAINQSAVEEERPRMGSNLSRHNSKGLNGRRTQSSGNLCDSKGKLNSMGKMLVPCSSGQRERYKLCGSLPNHLDDKINIEDDNLKENNNIMTDTLSGNLGGTLPNKKRSVGVHFMDHGSLDLVQHRSQDDLDENDPWRYHQSDLDLLKPRRASSTSNRRKTPNVDSVSTTDSFKKYKSPPRNFSETSNSLKYQRSSTLERTPKTFDMNLDFDLVGTIPKRKNEEKSEEKELPKEDENLSIQDSDLLMKIGHKPDCELVKHRQQLSNSSKGKLMVNKSLDLRINKLISKETQDQGYASEKSPEEEHLPSLPGEGFPNITPESTFRVTLQKSSRGLGLSVSGGGTAGPVRVKRLFPQQPAALSNKLQPGDILLAANGIPLTGLTNYEALEVLRTTPSTVELVVCRLPGENGNVPPPVAPPPPPRRENLPLNPLPPLQIEPCGEFDIEMTKVGGSLGFTLRKTDSSALGHYVRALVREPALSDGRIKPGDKIVAVDGAPLSPMSHAEAVRLLRQCGPTVKLRLYRDMGQTPVAALSPTEDYPSKTCLRQEAVDMLCDLAVRKLSPGASTGSSCKQAATTSSNSPRKVRRLTTKTPDSEPDSLEQRVSLKTVSTSNQSSSDFDQCSIRTQVTVNSQATTPGTDIIDPPLLYHVSDSSDSLKTPIPKKRPSFLNLSAPQDKPNYQFLSTSDANKKKQTKENATTEIEKNEEAENVEDENEGTKYLEEESEESECVEEDESNVTYNKVTKKEFKVIEPKEFIKEEESSEFPSEPASMPPLLNSANGVGFSYKNPAYQSANPAVGGSTGSNAAEGKGKHCSDQDIPGKVLGTEDPGGSKGLLKWKGVMFAPDDEGNKKEEKGNEEKKQEVDTTDSAKIKTDENLEQGTKVFMVELTRGWNSRLGFSLQSEGNRTVISVVHPDSVASKDGRLKQGDVLMMVNDETVEDMSTADIIDLLRKIRGSIGITVMRRNRRETS